MKKISIISPPFIGHYNVLLKLAHALKESKNDIHVTLIITGWKNVTLSNDEKNTIKSLGIDLIELYAQPMQIQGPFYFTFPRVMDLTPQLIKICENQDYLIYDFFSIEAYIAGKYLNIPTICSVASIMGPFDAKHPLFLDALKNNHDAIQSLEDLYKIDLFNRIEMLGDGFFISSDEKNIQWSWPSLISIDQYQYSRQLNNNIFMRPFLSSSKNDAKPSSKKTIYLSFGTIVTRYLWDIPTLKDFIHGIFQSLIKNFYNPLQYEVVISAGRNPNDIFSQMPSNFRVSESVSQIDILKRADIFITHGGGNSVNESLDLGVPMIVIPFFGDQHQSASNVHRLGLGKSFMHDVSDQIAIIDAASQIYERKSLLDKNNLVSTIEEVSHDPGFEKSIQQMTFQDKASMTSMDDILS